MVTINYNEVGKQLLNFRQGKECWKHLLFVDLGNVCTWRCEGEALSLMTWVGIHFRFPGSGGRERIYYLCFTFEGPEAERVWVNCLGSHSYAVSGEAGSQTRHSGVWTYVRKRCTELLLLGHLFLSAWRTLFHTYLCFLKFLLVEMVYVKHLLACFRATVLKVWRWHLQHPYHLRAC